LPPRLRASCSIFPRFDERQELKKTHAKRRRAKISCVSGFLKIS
jgi:hypothetical protein